MGMFDEVYVDCPVCDEGYATFQSKAGECTLATYTPFSVPPVIAADIGEDVQSCEKCGARIRLTFQVIVMPHITVDNQ